jgi:hypothetical protein
MTALPRRDADGRLKAPPIDPPKVDAHDGCNPADSVRIVKLTSYRHRDDSQYTHRVFDYRLRWTLYATHRSMDKSGKLTLGHLHATAEVWSVRDQEWHPVWELSREGASPYGADWKPKVSDWNAMLDKLAQYVTEVLL